MLCSAIMAAQPEALRDSETVAEAAGRLIGHRQWSLPVVDAGGRYIGMFGSDELLSLVVPRVAIAGNLAPNLRFVEDDPKHLAERFGELKTRTVGEAADRTATALAPNTPQIEAFRQFCKSRAPLPVVEPESRKLVGLVTFWDVMGQIMTDA